MNNRPMSARDWGVDVAVCVVAFLFGCGQLMLTASAIVVPDLALRQYLGIVNVVPSPPVFAALALTTLPVVVRRRFPIPVFAFCLVAFLMLQNAFDGFSLPIVGPVVALFTVADEHGRVELGVCLGVAIAGLVLGGAPSQTASLAFFTRVQNVVFVAAAALAGYANRTHRAYVRAVEDRAAEAERSREEEAARRVEEERVRIAREVHDITAHSLSAVSIQAAAAERMIDRDPAAAKEAIATARATAKSALEDIRSMIGVLRHGDDAVETAPAAGTDRMDDLVEYLRGAGLAVEIDAAGYDRARVPAHVDMALYTLAREATTNIVRHAHAQHASIRLVLAGGDARLVVEDDGRGCGTPFVPIGAREAGKSAAAVEAGGNMSGSAARADVVGGAVRGEGTAVRAALPQAADGAGHGIAGMAERAGLLGGAFAAGDLSGGGFCVEAAIPVRGSEA